MNSNEIGMGLEYDMLIHQIPFSDRAQQKNKIFFNYQETSYYLMENPSIICNLITESYKINVSHWQANSKGRAIINLEQN